MVRVEKDLKHYLIPNPCCGQTHLPLHQVAQSLIQPGLEYFQMGDVYKNTNSQVIFDQFSKSNTLNFYIPQDFAALNATRPPPLVSVVTLMLISMPPKKSTIVHLI